MPRRVTLRRECWLVCWLRFPALWCLTCYYRWSCRESNPGPTAFPRGFSVRSSLCLYSDLLITRTSQDDDPSRCWCPDESRDRTHRLIPLADARVRAEGFPGLTDSPSLRQRERSRADENRRLIGCSDA